MFVTFNTENPDIFSFIKFYFLLSCKPFCSFSGLEIKVGCFEEILLELLKWDSYKSFFLFREKEPRKIIKE